MSLGVLGADFGWTGRHLGQVLNRMTLRQGGLPLDKVVELGLAKPNGRAWNRQMCVALFEHLGVQRLSKIDRQAWCAVDGFLVLLNKAQKIENEDEKPGANEYLLQAAVKIFEVVPTKGNEGRGEMLESIDFHMGLSGVHEAFREKLYSSMGEDGASIVASGNARMLKYNETEQARETHKPRRL